MFCCFKPRNVTQKSPQVQLKGPLFGLQPVPLPFTSDHHSDLSSIPEDNPVDIIFVHGLGGSARGTWTHPETKEFWPEWLFQMNSIRNIRIYTFGYDSAWEKLWAPRNYLGIRGFAHQLIDSLILHYEENGDVCPI